MMMQSAEDRQRANGPGRRMPGSRCHNWRAALVHHAPTTEKLAKKMILRVGSADRRDRVGQWTRAVFHALLPGRVGLN